MQKKRHPSIDEVYNPEDLKDISVGHSFEELRHDFSEEEITKMKAEFFELNYFKDNRENILKSVKDALTGEWSKEDPTGENPDYTIADFVKKISFSNIGENGIKRLKKRIKELLDRITQKYEIRVEKLFAVSYNEFGLMAYYNEQGFFVYQRPCTASEMQTDINTNIHKLKQAN